MGKEETLKREKAKGAKRCRPSGAIFGSLPRRYQAAWFSCFNFPLLAFRFFPPLIPPQEEPSEDERIDHQ
jgi:hypothetical protein